MKRKATIGSVIFGENDPFMRSIIRSVLLQSGLEVFVAGDGQEAVLLAEQFVARLVLLDIGMPRMNGLLACQAIRMLPGYADVPIVILTGYTDERMRQAAEQVGASDFLTKPFRPDELSLRLGMHLGQPAGALAADRTVQWKSSPAPAPNGRDSAELENGRKALHIWRDVSGKL
jgi:DNA-binding response OmpR family regulator